jgi:O-antigen ligase
LGLVGLVMAAAIYQPPKISAPAKRVGRKVDPRLIYGVAGVAALVMLSLFMTRAEAIMRLLGQDSLDDGRWPMWRVGWDMVLKYFPTGSGFGSIVDAFNIDEPHVLLESNYTNHLHNDWLELLVCGGLPALLLLMQAIIAWARATRATFSVRSAVSRADIFARLGSAVILMLAGASAADYPLRVPSLSCLLVLAAVWLANPGDQLGGKSGHMPFRDGNG